MQWDCVNRRQSHSPRLPLSVGPPSPPAAGAHRAGADHAAQPVGAASARAPRGDVDERRGEPAAGRRCIGGLPHQPRQNGRHGESRWVPVLNKTEDGRWAGLPSHRLFDCLPAWFVPRRRRPRELAVGHQALGGCQGRRHDQRGRRVWQQAALAVAVMLPTHPVDAGALWMRCADDAAPACRPRMQARAGWRSAARSGRQRASSEWRWFATFEERRTQSGETPSLQPPRPRPRPLSLLLPL